MKGFVMEPYHELLLRGNSLTRIGLYDLFQATAEQLTRLYSYKPGSLNMVKLRLKQLEDAKFVEARSYPIPREGKRLRLHYGPRWYYILGPAAKRYFEDLGYEMPEGWPAHRPTDGKGIFMDHELERNDVVITAALLRHEDPRLVLERFRHARLFAHDPIRVTVSGMGQKLIPDGLLDFRNPETDLHLVVLLEHDKDTEQQLKFKAKIRKYAALMTMPEEQRKSILHCDAATIAFTTFAGMQRLDQMRTWTEEVLVEMYAAHDIGHWFRFAALPKPVSPGAAWLEPRWLSPYAGDEPEPLLVA